MKIRPVMNVPIALEDMMGPETDVRVLIDVNRKGILTWRSGVVCVGGWG